jgi:CBS domain-containing protein
MAEVLSRGVELIMHDEAVRSLVKQAAVVAYPESTLREVALILSEESIGAVVVRGTRPPGAPGSRAEGVVSERDIVQALADGHDPDRTRAQDVMTMDLATAAPEESVLDVAARMLDNEIRHIPVIEDGVVVGVVSERDVLRVLVDEHQRQ